MVTEVHTNIIKEFEAGNARVRAGEPLHNGQDIATLMSLKDGQSPVAAVLECSDSRVNFVLATDSPLGRVFVVKVAGEIVGPSEVASLEYAVQHLKVPMIFIVAHENCGAIAAGVKAPDGHVHKEGQSHLCSMVETIRKHLEPYIAKHENDPGLVEAAMYQALAVRREMIESSALIKAAVAGGHLAIVPAFLRFETGALTFFPYKIPATALNGPDSCQLCVPEKCNGDNFSRCRLERNIGLPDGVPARDIQGI